MSLEACKSEASACNIDLSWRVVQLAAREPTSELAFGHLVLALRSKTTITAVEVCDWQHRLSIDLWI